MKAAVAPARVLPARAFTVPVPLWSAMGLLLAALLLRAPMFGNPAPYIDEQFYLLVGDRMLHGALPYVDIWDRKPIGLFLVYAAIRLLGGDGIVQYQVVAALFAGAGAILVSRIARRVAPEPAAIVSGLAYLFWIELVEGGGGQAPVFYNPLIAGAALATMQAIESPDSGAVLRRGSVAMALVGIAIQIKTTAVVEGCFFGLVLSEVLLRRLPLALAARQTSLLAFVALLPTLAAGGLYVALDHGDAWVFANVRSILLRNPAVDGRSGARLTVDLMHLVPLALGCVGSAWHLRHGSGNDRSWLLFMAGWIVAALVGFLSVGAYYAHYLLPVYIPFAAGIAPIVGRRPLGIGFAALALLVPAPNLEWPDRTGTRQAQAAVSSLVAALPADVGRECLFEFDGPPILYLLGHACARSRFVFPDHLSSLVEAAALGVDPVAELRRILATAPAAITMARQPPVLRNPQTATVLERALASHYRLAGSGTIDGRTIDLYVRR